MERLTSKENDEYRLILPDHTHDGDMSNFNAELERSIDQGINKLGQLEDLMEKYNIKTLEQVESSFIGFVTDYTEEGRNHIEELLKLEDELGIDLITLFKALKNGIFFIEEGKIRFNLSPNIVFVKTCDIGSKPYFIIQCFGNKQYDFTINEYGKFWAFTKEELE